MTDGAKIKVYVIDYNRRFLVLQWTDPTTGKRVTRSSKTTKRREASIKAAELEKKLNETRATGDGSISWSTFFNLYQLRELSGHEPVTERWHTSKLTVFESKMHPTTLADVNSICLARYVAQLRGAKYTEETIRGHMVAVRIALRWGVNQGYIAGLPNIPAARMVGGRKVKGRDLTFWEFVRMLRAVSLVVGPDQVASWRHLLIGLWVSGLRIGEAVRLSWDDPTAPRVNLSGAYPLLEIDAEDDKGREHRLLPITPDFGRFLLRTPKSDRKGLVFSVVGAYGQEIESQNRIGAIISKIGKAAKIIVDHRRDKTASAHDLRRTFGTRWARKVMPITLKDLMRHAAIETTMHYYVGQHAQTTSAELWKLSPRRHTTENTTPAQNKQENS